MDRAMDELLLQPATAVAARLRAGELSSRELTAALLERIDATGAALNAVVELRREAALREAAERDLAATRGAALGPLHGVPVTVKEAFDVEGLHTTWGNPEFSGFVACRDATVVRRLREAGAVVAGKTNLAMMLADYGQSANPLYGATRNPWDLARSPGGSSGGAAAAVAAGLSFLDYGSDLVGSIRIPASFCGVYGLKPSARLVPQTGFQPPGPPQEPSGSAWMAALGPIARSAADLRAALEVTAGPQPPAATAWSWSLPPARRERLVDLRVGVVLDHPVAPVSSEVAGPLSDAVDALARGGATIVEGWPEGVDPEASFASFGFQVGLFFAYQQPGEDFAKVSAVAEQERRRMAIRAAWDRWFERIDVFLCPANFTPAFPHDARPFEQRTVATPEGERRYDLQAFWVSHASLAGLPAVAAPVGLTGGGLPVGAQLIGPPYEDGTAIAAAELLAGVIGGFRPPPG
jgi:amidase